MATVGIVVPVFNGEHLLAETLRSILGQDYRDFMAYVVDDGSTDRTGEVVASFASDPRIHYIRQGNAGQAAAINRGISVGEEPYLSLCDADDLWRSDRLGASVSALKENSSLGLVCNDFAKGCDPGRTWISAWTTLGYRPLSGDAFERLLEHNFIPRSGVLMPRCVLRQIGHFSEAVGGRCGCDDWDMWLKIARVYPILCLHETLTFKRVVDGQHSTRLSQSQSRVLLWDRWENELRDQNGRTHEIAAKQLSNNLLDLARRMIIEGLPRSEARAQLMRAARSAPRLIRYLGFFSVLFFDLDRCCL